MDTRTPVERHRAMAWVQRLKRVFKLDLTRGENCGDPVRVLASIEDPAVIGNILAHREARRLEPRRARPQCGTGDPARLMIPAAATGSRG